MCAHALCVCKKYICSEPLCNLTMCGNGQGTQGYMGLYGPPRPISSPSQLSPPGHPLLCPASPSPCLQTALALSLCSEHS